MKHPVTALGLVALASLLALDAGAQGLRPSAGTGLSRSATAGPALALPVQEASQTPRAVDFIVAVVNSEPLTNNEVRARATRIAQQIQQQGGNLPPQDVLLREITERLVLEKIQLQQARETRIRVDDYAVDQAEQQVARQNGLSVDELVQRLTREGMGRERFREELRNQLVLQRLRDRDLDARVRVTDADIDQFLRDQASGADLSTTEINLGHVLVIVPENAPPQRVAELQARAQQAADKLRAGEEFAAVAREFSDAPEARNAGGQLGLRPADRYPDLFVDATRNVAVGNFVGPVRSPAGFHVLKVIERVNAGVPAAVVQSRARHILLRTGPQLSEAAAADRLADYRRRIMAGQADFAALAREHSSDGSARNGGDLGWTNPGQFVPEFEEALNALQPGQLSQPVVSRFGVHLIKLEERRQAKLTPREQRDMVRETVRQKKLEEAYGVWVQELRGRAYVEYRDPPQ